METLDHFDRERRQVKQRAWCKKLFHPSTLKLTLAVLPLLTKLAQIGIIIIKIFGE